MPSARRAAVPGRRRRRSTWRRRAGWPVVVVGGLLAAYGFIGNALGVELFFDRHHTPSQMVGLVLVILGISWATSRQ